MKTEDLIWKESESRIWDKLGEHDERIANVEKLSTITSTKLDLTNKLLGGILLVLLTGLVNLMFTLIAK